MGATTPNDPKFDQQWPLQNTGQLVNWTKGTPGSDINVTRVWEVTTGSKSVVIGLVDDGLDHTAYDLAPNVWVNPGGINGCPAGTHGYDALSGTCEPEDPNGHGTSMAMIMGAVGNNGQGIAGVNWTTSIMASTTNQSRSASTLVAAIDWVIRAKQAGVNVRVINGSLTDTFGNNQAIADQIARAGEHGILVVVAADNYKKNTDVTPVYPCSFRLWNEICVAASDQNDRLWGQSNYGAQSVDLAAPGVNICAGPYEGPCGADGTSDATAFVSGAAALLVSADSSLTVSQLKARILDNVRPVSALSGKVRTGGVLDVYCALTNCRAPTTSSSPPANLPPSGGSSSSSGSSPSSGGSSSVSKSSGQTAGSSSSVLPTNPLAAVGLPKSSTRANAGSNDNDQPGKASSGESDHVQNVLATRSQTKGSSGKGKALWIALGVIAFTLVMGLTRDRKTITPQEFL